MEILFAGMITGFLLALPTGPGAFAVIRAVVTQGFKAGIKTAFAPIGVDLFWMAVVIFEPHIIAALKQTNWLLYNGMGWFMLLVSWVIWKSNKDIPQKSEGVKKNTFWSTFWMVLPNFTIAITGGFVLSLVAPQYTLFSIGSKVLLVVCVLLCDIAAWLVIIASTQKLSRSFSLLSLTVAYCTIIGVGGVIMILKPVIGKFF